MSDPEVRMAKCRTCLTYKVTTDFYVNGYYLFKDCKACFIQAKETQRSEFIRWIHEIKTTAGCADCGYNASPYALQFDHLPGHKKLFGIATGGSRSRKSVLAEIAKTEVVCANCHSVRTASRIAERKKDPQSGS